MNNVEQLEFLVDYYELLKKKNAKTAYSQFQQNLHKLATVGEIDEDVYSLVNNIITFSAGVQDKKALLEYINTFVSISNTKSIKEEVTPERFINTFGLC